MTSIFCRWVLLVSICVMPTLLLTGCSESETSAADSDDVSETDSAPSMAAWQGGTAEAAPLPSPEEAFNTATILGDRAAQVAQTAQTETDWAVAAARWEQALNLLKAIPPETAQYDAAQAKIGEYDAQLQNSRRALAQVRF